jgi:hypothetical protein
LVGRAREVIEHITKILDHGVVVGRIIACYAKYLQLILMRRVTSEK